MANECLLTSFKGVIENDSLMKYGEFPFDFREDSGNTITVSNAKAGAVFRIIGDGYFTDSDGASNYGKEFEAPTGVAYMKATGNGKLLVPNKYDITTLALSGSTFGKFSTDIENVAYSSNLFNYFNCTGVLLRGQADALIGKVSRIFNAELVDEQTDLAAFVQSFLNNTSPSEQNPSLQISQDLNKCINNVNYSQFEGWTNLTVRISGAMGYFEYLADTKSTFIYNTTEEQASRVTGSIEGYVSRAIANGKSTGSFRVAFPLNYTSLMYNNKPLSESGFENNSQATFSWDSLGNITWTNVGQ